LKHEQEFDMETFISIEDFSVVKDSGFGEGGTSCVDKAPPL